MNNNGYRAAFVSPDPFTCSRYREPHVLSLPWSPRIPFSPTPRAELPWPSCCPVHVETCREPHVHTLSWSPQIPDATWRPTVAVPPAHVETCREPNPTNYVETYRSCLAGSFTWRPPVNQVPTNAWRPTVFAPPTTWRPTVADLIFLGLPRAPGSFT